MANNELERLANKIALKNANNISVSKDTAELVEVLSNKAKDSKALSSALGLDENARAELTSFLGDAVNFPLLDLEKTLLYMSSITAAYKEHTYFDKNIFEKFSSRLSAAQWHFNEVSKPLTKEYLNASRVSTILPLSPYGNYDDAPELISNELENLESVLGTAQKAVSDKDFQMLYKSNADLITITTNITLCKYFVCKI